MRDTAGAYAVHGTSEIAKALKIGPGVGLSGAGSWLIHTCSNALTWLNK